MCIYKHTPMHTFLSPSLHIYIYIYIYIYLYTCMYIYIYRERKREICEDKDIIPVEHPSMYMCKQTCAFSADH